MTTEFRRELARLSAQTRYAVIAQRLFGDLRGDELDVIGRVVERLQLGRGIYGELDIRRDVRQWKKERRDELVDALIYDCIDAGVSALLREESSAVSAPLVHSSLSAADDGGAS